MADWEDDEARVHAAINEALRIPGVHSANSGIRYRNGQKTGEPALRVYVLRKKRLDELSPRERVPPEILGIPTDVIESDFPERSVELAHLDPDPGNDVPNFDSKEYAQVRGGIPLEGAYAGTLACIARAVDPAHTSKLVILSNHHVLMGDGNKTGISVYQPESSCCCCGRKIGVVLRGHDTMTNKFVEDNATTPSIDAAIALVNPGVPCLAEIQVGLGDDTATELVRGVMPKADIKKDLLVKKRGARTGQTHGIITAVDDTFTQPQGGPDAYAHRFQIIVEPVIAPGTTEGFFYFGAPGDSGSLIVSESGDNAVALHWGSRNTYPIAGNKKYIVRESLETNIHHVMLAMEITIATTSTAGQVLTNAAEDEGMQPELPTRPAFARSMLARARADIEQTRYGAQYVELIRRHHREVARLVNGNRRVGTVWKRNGGPQLVQAVLDAVGRPKVAFPSSIGGRSIAEVARRIGTVLRRYGSHALVRDLDAYERAVPRLCGCTYDGLLARLRAGAPLLQD